MGWKIRLQKVGPGVFFALFGAVGLIVALQRPLDIKMSGGPVKEYGAGYEVSSATGQNSDVLEYVKALTTAERLGIGAHPVENDALLTAKPFVLTQARRLLVGEGRVIEQRRGKTPWFHLSDAKPELIAARFAELEPIYAVTQDGGFSVRLGQALEIAVYKALSRGGQVFLGGFSDLPAHDDSRLYKRIEPPRMLSGKTIEKGPLDYIVAQTGCAAGLEVKNYRTWLYPHSPEIRELLWKCSDIDAVPVLIARRIPFITFRLLNLSGGIVHQTYNQLYPAADAGLAQMVKQKNLLGYHDVRVGNEPDARLLKFLCTDLPRLKEAAKPEFMKYRDVHLAYGKGKIEYREWVREIFIGSGVWAERRGGEETDPSGYM